ncbi:hypothetical protein [Porphyromonas gingivicanis]|uniref:hypothetical protein n=1 Tax=Porphyromonas gingivicanis TaxID=266762 RepID=UPI00046EF9E2|nr:hypothetical protein [Porphyromonas gingivicanis]
MDCSSPRLHTAQGYPEADLRRKFVRQEKETLQALDRIAQRLYTEGSKLSAQEWRKATEEGRKLEQKLQTQAAHFIVANKEKLGIAALADEYFPSFEGALDFLHLYPNESLPHHLLRLNNYIAYWKSRSTDTLWRDPHLFPMPSTLRKVWEKRPLYPSLSTYSDDRLSVEKRCATNYAQSATSRFALPITLHIGTECSSIGQSYFYQHNATKNSMGRFACSHASLLHSAPRSSYSTPYHASLGSTRYALLPPYFGEQPHNLSRQKPITGIGYNA